MIVGIELAPGSIRAVGMDRPRPGSPPDNATLIPFAPDADGLPPQEVFAELSRRFFDPGLLCVALSMDLCLYRTVRFPFQSQARIESTLKYSLEGRLPGSIEEFIVEPLSATRKVGESGSAVLAAACEHDRIASLLARFKAAGLEPDAIVPSPVALSRAFGSVEVTALVLRVAGESSVEVALISNGLVLAATGVSRFGDDAQQLVAELRRRALLWNHLDGHPMPDRVILMVPEDLKVALSSAAREAFDVPVETSSMEPAAAAAFGALLEYDAKKLSCCTLRREDLAHPKRAKRFEKRKLTAVLVAAAALLAVGIGLSRFTADAKSDLRKIVREQSDIYREVTGMPGPPLLLTMQSKLAEAKKSGARGGEMKSCLRYWIAFERLLPQDKPFRITRLEFNQQGGNFSAAASDQVAVTDFKKRLESSSDFMPDPRLEILRTTGGEYSFTMEFRYR